MCIGSVNRPMLAVVRRRAEDQERAPRFVSNRRPISVCMADDSNGRGILRGRGQAVRRSYARCATVFDLKPT